MILHEPAHSNGGDSCGTPFHDGTEFHLCQLGTAFHVCHKGGMGKTTRTAKRRQESLSRERIIEASIEILDSDGEEGLTFRALSDRLATGPGAIYWHIDSKSELLTAACDAIVAHAVDAPVLGMPPEDAICALSLSLFDAIDAHPWVGAALTHAPGQMPVVRILERIGQQVRALHVRDGDEWQAVCALLNYIVGVSRQNAANAQFTRTRGLYRSTLLESLAITWSQLDRKDYPFTCDVADQLPDHDDRADFLAGIKFFLSGLRSST
ncbi:TetR/AcrR family transcriptional regulator [Gluconacetobacter sacchari]